MLSFTGSLRVFVALEPCDMRKGFDGLSGMVATKLNEDLQSGALFVFSNRRHTRLKIIYWDGTGLWLMAKRLEKGTFSWPKDTDGKTNQLDLFAVLPETQAPEPYASLLAGAMIPAKPKSKSPSCRTHAGKVGKDEGRSQKGCVDAVRVVAFAYDIYTNPSKNNGVLRATLTAKSLPHSSKTGSTSVFPVHPAKAA